MNIKYILVGFLWLLPITGFAKERVPLDPNCQRAAEVGEGLARLREIGYSVKEMDSFTTEPSVQVFPVQALKAYVYTLNKNPNDTKQTVLGFCQYLGFDSFNRYLLLEQNLVNAQLQNESLTEKIEQLIKENQQLRLELETKKAKK